MQFFFYLPFYFFPIDRSKVAWRAPGSALLPECFFRHVAGPAGQTALADHAPEALANSEPGTASLHPLWTLALRGWGQPLHSCPVHSGKLTLWLFAVVLIGQWYITSVFYYISSIVFNDFIFMRFLLISEKVLDWRWLTFNSLTAGAFRDFITKRLVQT